MKTDETNLPRGPAKVPRRIDVNPASRSVASHGRGAAEGEIDALDAWRNSMGEHGTPPDPVQVHGFDVDASDDSTRAVIETFSAELALLHRALEAAEVRLARSEEARRIDPDTGMLRRDVFFSEIRHLEHLDRREGAASEIAILRVEGFAIFRDGQGRAAALRAQRVLAVALADVVDPAEPACALGDGEFAVLLTGLHGAAAAARADAIGQELVGAIDRSTETAFLRPGHVAIGRVALGENEAPLDAIDRADRKRE